MDIQTWISMVYIRFFYYCCQSPNLWCVFLHLLLHFAQLDWIACSADAILNNYYYPLSDRGLNKIPHFLLSPPNWQQYYILILIASAWYNYNCCQTLDKVQTGSKGWMPKTMGIQGLPVLYPCPISWFWLHGYNLLVDKAWIKCRHFYHFIQLQLLSNPG